MAGGVKGVFGAAIFAVAIVASSFTPAWTSAASSTFAANVDPSLRAGELAIVHTTSGSAGALSVKLSGLGATSIETDAAADTVIARLSPAALAAVATDRTVTVASADTVVVAADDHSTGYENGAPSGADNTDGASVALQSINGPRAWDTSTGEGVTVAVMDTGIAQHPDLNDKVLARVDFVHDGSRSADPAGHGTHIAGIIAAHGGMNGVAFDAKLVSLRVLDAKGSGSLASVVRAFDWLLQHREQYHIKVVNLSWGMPAARSYSTDLLSALAESAWFSGITVVASAGNSGQDTISTPAADPFVVAVGSFGDKGTPDLSDDRESTFSSRATTVDGFAKPDVLAPGEHIKSLRVAGDAYLDANGDPVGSPSDLYIKMTGTSAAAGFASGVAALVIAAHRDYTPNSVKGALVASGRTVVGGSAKGLDAAKALRTDFVANQKIAPSKILVGMLTKSGLLKGNGVTWEGVTWEGITWNGITWESVSWESVSWEGVTWEGITWDMAGLQ